jgi:vacuolar-type H+-ATPase subunit F/Vma7
VVTDDGARVLGVTTADLAAGFRLAGAAVTESDTAEAAAGAIKQAVAEGERGVIAVYEPYLEDMDPETRLELSASVSPVVVPIPPGLTGAGEGRRARLASLLQRAVGYHISFGEES